MLHFHVGATVSKRDREGARKMNLADPVAVHNSVVDLANSCIKVLKMAPPAFGISFAE